MANQSIGTPRFYLDFTQLAKAKGIIKDPSALYPEHTEDDASNARNLSDNFSPHNMNVWNFDYANPKEYTFEYDLEGTPQNLFQFRITFWDWKDPTKISLEWAKILSTANWAGVLNHNLNSAFPRENGFDKSFNFYLWNNNFNALGEVASPVSKIATLDPPYADWVNREIDSDGFTIVESGEGYKFWGDEYLFNEYGGVDGNDEDINLFSNQFWQFHVDTTPANDNTPGNYTEPIPFNIGTLALGKYIDLPHSPDLKVKKSVIYDGYKIKRSLDGSDYVQIDNQGQPSWLVGEPWTLSDAPAEVFVYEEWGLVAFDSDGDGVVSWDDIYDYMSAFGIADEEILNSIWSMLGLTEETWQDQVFVETSFPQTYKKRGRIGRNGRRSWDLSFSYISNDDLFYDWNERSVGGTTTISEDGTESEFNPTSDLQQIWDFTLGGILKFLFCPDTSLAMDKREFAVCTFDKNSLVSSQVAHNTWNIKMKIVEVW